MSRGPAPQPSSLRGQSWTVGAKDLVMTALGASRVWATLAHGIFNEMYWPVVDQPQIKDFGFLVAGEGWWRELKRVNDYTLSTPDPAVALPTMRHIGEQYHLDLQAVVDPDRDALLVSYMLEGDKVRLYPLIALHLGVSQQTPEGSWPAIGADNYAWVDPTDGALFGSAGDRCVCVLASSGFSRASAGYVGESDGWTDFATNGAMTWTYSQAGPGVTALMGELIEPQGQLVLAFGATAAEARATAKASLAAGFDVAATKFVEQWHTWAAGLTLPGTEQGLSQELSDAIRQSAAVLRTHEDRGVPGAFVAGLAIPWGDDTNDPGGYHMVWCRDSTEAGLALAAAGQRDDAKRLLAYLISRQQADGHWPRCFFVDGSFDPLAAVQLDETALPVVLAAKLEELGISLPDGSDDMMRRAARYLAQVGPVFGVDLWEENVGGSAFTIGLEIAALVIAASRLVGQERDYALALADNWNERLEEFTYISGGELDQAFGTTGHYVRIGPPTEQVRVGNQPQQTSPTPAEALIGMEFLYLPRLGLRDPSDERITDTLKVVEEMISRQTASGRAYYRYNFDGYGEWTDGSGWPVRKFGLGRPWPLLVGERGHYEKLAGRDPGPQLAAMLAMRGRGGLLPEQIWDTNPVPWKYLQIGQPSGSAMPLAWAHSELIKLALTASSGRPVEMLKAVTDRYPSGRVPTSSTWFWRDNAPVLGVPDGRSLVVEDTQPFTLHFGFDEWTGVTEREAQPLGLGMFGVTMQPGDLAGHSSLQFVRRYANGQWEERKRNDVQLHVQAAPTLRLSAGERGRVTAAGSSRSSVPSG